MKTAYFIAALICFSLTGKAQNNWKKIADSLAILSRERADKVLSHFDTIQVAKILYSLEDKYFYLIIKDKLYYKEYYVTIDNLGEIEGLRPIKADLGTRKQRKQQKEYEKLLSEAKPIFDFSTYHKNYINKVPEATFVRGRPSYFVVKDIDGKRYGEYSLSAITTPLPIKASLWVYLTRRFSDEMAIGR